MKIRKENRECAICHREYNSKALCAMELEIKPKIRLINKLECDGNALKVISTYGTHMNICPHCVKALIEEIARKAEECNETERPD